VTDEHGTWIGNPNDEISVYDAETPYGPFTCRKCGAEYDSLPECDNREFNDWFQEHKDDKNLKKVWKDVLDKNKDYPLTFYQWCKEKYYPVCVVG
jgi:hypothetical protein